MTITTNIITLKYYNAEQVWTKNVIDIILLLCPFSDCCMSLRCNNETIKSSVSKRLGLKSH